MDINEVFLRGEAVTAPSFTHTVGGRSFYGFRLSVKRLSGVADVINVVTSCNDIEPFGLYEITGSMRSRNTVDGDGRHLILSVFASSLRPLPKEEFVGENTILICGTLCKPPILRSTPLGRELCDLPLAVRRPYGRADFLPLIAWGRNASIASEFTVGSHLRCEGRIQSREYVKRTEDGAELLKTAYEVSLSRIDRAEDVSEDGETVL
ncbi:MAG: single-stranded DNA-binding protein [Clostridia bacterium]|nr:single-stranded DNA-binding protein [Clostridia bacterium]